MALFHDVRLPDSIEQGSHGGPEFRTSIIPMGSGFEQRNVDWQNSRQFWDISYGIDDQVSYNAVRDFFYARRARAYAFRFRDWSDYTLTLEQIGVGDGVKTDFQITKTYEPSGPLPYVRRITRPDTTTLTVSVNGAPTVLYSNQPLGIVRFNVAPPAAQVIRVIAVEYDIPVRFDNDRFDLTLEQVLAGAVGGMNVTEDRE